MFFRGIFMVAQMWNVEELDLLKENMEEMVEFGLVGSSEGIAG